MGAAEKSATDFHAVSNHFALAVVANRRHRLDCALEAVKSVVCAGCYQLETFVVLVATDFACCHIPPPSPALLLKRYTSRIRCLLPEDRCPGGHVQVRVTWHRVELPQPDVRLCSIRRPNRAGADPPVHSRTKGTGIGNACTPVPDPGRQRDPRAQLKVAFRVDRRGVAWTKVRNG